MASDLPDLTRYGRVAIDTETTGLSYWDRPVGLSWATPDGRSGYVHWGHTVSGPKEVAVPDQTFRWLTDLIQGTEDLILHHALFDLRMLAYLGQDRGFSWGDNPLLRRRPVHDTQFIEALIRGGEEKPTELSLGFLSQKYAEEDGQKFGDDAQLWELLANQFGGQATRKAQAKNIYRAPHQWVAPYAIQDAVATLATFDAQEPLVGRYRLGDLYDLERGLLPVSLRMHLEGVPVDVGATKKLRQDLMGRLRAAQRDWEDLTGGVNVRSTAQLYDFFQSKAKDLGWADHVRFSKALQKEVRGVDAVIRWTEKGNPSLTQEVLENLMPDNPYSDLILEMRKLHHYGGTFLKKYLVDKAVLSEDPREGVGVLHPLFHQLRNPYYGTRSGRFSSSDPNAQNIPSRDKVWAPLIRGLFVPREGCRWVKADYSQIEYRFLAHYADLLRRVQNSRSPLALAYEADPHTDFHQMAADIAGIERRPAKDINFATVYGAGDEKLAKMLGRPVVEAAEIRAEYHRRAPDIAMTYTHADRRANAKGYIRTWGGRLRRFPPKGKGRGHHFTYKALNSLLQGSAADLMKFSMARVAEEVTDWDTTVMHLTVHDELDFSVREDHLEEVSARLREAMETGLHDMEPGSNRLSSGVAVLVDLETGPNWGDLTEKE